MPRAARVRPAKDKSTPRKKASKQERTDTDISLPEEANTPPNDISKTVCCIYGRKGIGKTSLAAMFPNAMTFMFERGRRNLPIKQIPKEGEVKLDWERYKQYVEKILGDDKYDTVIVDTVDRCYDRCMEYVCAKNGCTHPNQKNDYGDTWNQVRSEFDAVLGLIHEAGKGIVLVSHESLKPLVKQTKGLKRADDEEEAVFERIEPSCTGQAFGVIQEICDYVLYYGFFDEYRTITVRSPNDVHWTSCGIGDSFLNPDGTVINTFRVGNSAQKAYQDLVAAFKNESKDVDWRPSKRRK